VERFYRARWPPVTIGIETTGYIQWFHALMHQLGYTVLVGEAAKVTGSHRPLPRQASSQRVHSSAARETGTHARRELRDREGLGQVVGCSEFEAGTGIALVIQCRQHEDWQLRRR
jgi:hypothetical protein